MPNSFIETNRAARGYDFLPDSLTATFPALYATEDIPTLDKLVHARFFIGVDGDDRESSWWLVEYDPEQDLAFGFVVLNNESSNSEFGYFAPFGELEHVAVPVVREGIEDVLIVHRDLFWEPKPIAEAIPKRLHKGWWG